jgi:tetratricopeptide (TPR) repeat protein
MGQTVSHYCQRCLAANPLGHDFCIRCGTRLMIIVEPAASRFELSESGVPTDEHLLERISAAENRISRLTERLDRSLDLLLRHAQNTYVDRSLVKALISLLTDDGVVKTERLEKLWNERCTQDAVEQEESVRRDELRLGIIGQSTVVDKKAFEELVNRGFHLLNDKQISRGITKLQRAAEMCGASARLSLFLGEHFFRSGKTKQARTYLAKAYDSMPDDAGVSLLLGLACADEGEIGRAKELLRAATRRGGSCFAGHYGLGWVFAAENDWRHALVEFKQALSTRPSPEAHYVLGCLYYQLNRDTLAVRHLRKATEMDENYSEAFCLLARVYRRTGRKILAEQAMSRASKLDSSLSETEEKPTQNARSTRMLPLFSASMARSIRLMSGVDRRLAAALKEDALRAFK